MYDLVAAAGGDSDEVEKRLETGEWRRKKRREEIESRKVGSVQYGTVQMRFLFVIIAP